MPISCPKEKNSALSILVIQRECVASYEVCYCLCCSSYSSSNSIDSSSNNNISSDDTKVRTSFANFNNVTDINDNIDKMMITCETSLLKMKFCKPNILYLSQKILDV